MKKLTVLFAANIVVVAALFTLSELAVRTWVPQITEIGTTKSIFADSVYFSTHALIPLSSGTTNGSPVSADCFGFRASSVPVDTSKNSWLLIGDSVTFGIGITDDSTFAAILEANIDSLNVLNPSVSGNNINNYIDIFRYFVINNEQDLKINHVSLMWCLNDIHMTMTDFDMPGGTLRYIFSDVLTYIRIHSRLYHFTKKLLFDRPRAYYEFDAAPYLRKDGDLEQAVAVVREMQEICDERGITLDVVLLPYEFQFRKGDFRPQMILKQALSAAGVATIDIFSDKALQRFDSQRLYLYGDGIHFSNLGHRLIAASLMAGDLAGAGILRRRVSAFRTQSILRQQKSVVEFPD